MTNIEFYDDDVAAFERLASELKIAPAKLFGAVVNSSIGIYAETISRLGKDSDEDVCLAVAYAKIRGKVSCASLQRAFGLSYNAASKAIAKIEELGVMVRP